MRNPSGFTAVAEMDDGRVITGEYVGAQDGYVYLATPDEVHRVETRRIAYWRVTK